jgi:uncharacterized paraquat-inducible protein A
MRGPSSIPPIIGYGSYRVIRRTIKEQECPKCGTHLDITLLKVGSKIQCTACQNITLVQTAIDILNIWTISLALLGQVSTSVLASWLYESLTG